MGHVQSRRCLNLQEYASKKLMSEYGVNVQKFGVAETPKEAVTVARHLSKLFSFIGCCSVSVMFPMLKKDIAIDCSKPYLRGF